MKLVMIRLAKADDGTVLTRLGEIAKALKARIESLGDTRAVLTPYDGSVFISLVKAEMSASTMLAKIREVPHFSIHDDVLILDVGEEFAHQGQNAVLTWMQKA